MSYIFGKLWHSAIIWPIRKSFQCILQSVRFLLAKQTRLSGTSDNESYATYSSPRSECAHGVTGKRGPTRQNALSGAEQRTAPLTHTGAHKARRTTPASGTTIIFSVLHSEPQQTANNNKQSFIWDSFVNW